MKRIFAKSISTIGLLVALLLWGSAFAGVRFAVQEYHPLHLVAFRFGVASIVLGGFALISRQIRKPESKDLTAILLQGLFGITFYHLLLSWGQVTTPAGTASLLNASSPCMTAILATFFLGEKLYRKGWLGIVIGLAGVSLLVVGQGKDLHLALGAILILLAAFSQGIYFILQRPYFKKYSPLELASYTIWAGTIPLLLFLRLPEASPSATLAVIYLGIFPAAVAYIAWTYALSRIPTARAASFLYLVPLIAVGVAWIWLREVPNTLSLLAGFITVLGVFFVNSR